MVSISLCMIVKNEERVLRRCLDSVADLCEEIIIVDTGSSDKTKEIASDYTDLIYDFTWTGSFSDARNYAFSKATKDYIYSADADEVIDDVNRKRFLELKKALIPEVEIVQMKYVEDTISTVLNAREEYRPKLYKRLREFTWIDPVHETVRTLPVVFDSDIEILHLPESLHSGRDFKLIEAAYNREGILSNNLLNMYVRELYKCANADELKNASPILEELLEKGVSEDLLPKIFCTLLRQARLNNDDVAFIKYSAKLLALGACSEACCEIGDYFLEHNDAKEAKMWYYNAANETESILDIDKQNFYPQKMLEY